ncbi:uncharacterized protein LOC131293731 [Anopheles ziemanni]|uniref:uncharacterized protein LOC131264514 n=1 Tax=Anopheles coustani TaxID=139045 RepID=UPI00265823E6|nr:uncharacterized protein LOC131264514 [Anopheles coustani]XP_058177781.1 uncharacterized protein LOC131293731 [Anopheles ziemanni]
MRLYAANGTPITVYGQTLHELDLSLRRPVLWNFVIADVGSAILGADFLHHHDLMVDLRGRCLIDNKTKLRAPGNTDQTSVETIRTFDATSSMSDLLRKYPQLTSPDPLGTTQHMGVSHRIETTGKPVSARARRLAPEKYDAAKGEFEALMRLGICRPSNSCWASALHMVRKADGTWRPCGGYRALNAQTVPDRYPLPYLQYFTIHLRGSRLQEYL